MESSLGAVPLLYGRLRRAFVAVAPYFRKGAFM